MRYLGPTKALLAALLLATATRAGALSASLGTGSKLGFEGDSTMHKFDVASTKTQLKFESQPADLGAMLTGQAPVQLSLTVPVDGLKSEHAGLDKNMRKALKADQFPDITFALASYKLDKEAVTVTGDLTIAGVKKTIEVPGTYKLADGKMVVDGEKALLMSEYGIKPPTMMMGAVKVADKIVVKFHLALEQDKK